MASASRKIATLAEVAAEAGVSATTASRVLSGRGYSSEDARKRVTVAARRLKYTPNRAARALRTARRQALGVVVPNLGLSVYVPWLRAAGGVAQQHGYVSLICDTQGSPEIAQTQLQWLLEERVAGILFAGWVCSPASLRELRAAGIPIAPNFSTRQRSSPPRERAERAATLEAYEHLFALGHRRVAYFGWERPSLMQDLRIRLLEEAARNAGLRTVGPTVRVTSTGDCREQSTRLARRSRAPTAFVAGTSELTAAVLAGLATAEARIPDDVSVLAFGEGAWEPAYVPGISVVRHDYHGIATELTRQLIGRIEGWKSIPRVHDFPSTYVRRGSVGPAPHAKPRRDSASS